MIKKLIIEKEKSGFLPLEPNSEDKQRLTINAKGMVWFTAYGADAEWNRKSIRKYHCRLTIESAEYILSLAESLFGEVHGLIEPPLCDGETDVLTAMYDSGYKCRQLIVEDYHPTMTQLFEEIRKAIPINNLLLFDYKFLTE